MELSTIIYEFLTDIKKVRGPFFDPDAILISPRNIEIMKSDRRFAEYEDDDRPVKFIYSYGSHTIDVLADEYVNNEVVYLRETSGTIYRKFFELENT